MTQQMKAHNIYNSNISLDDFLSTAFHKMRNKIKLIQFIVGILKENDEFEIEIKNEDNPFKRYHNLKYINDNNVELYYISENNFIENKDSITYKKIGLIQLKATFTNEVLKSLFFLQGSLDFNHEKIEELNFFYEYLTISVGNCSIADDPKECQKAIDFITGVLAT